MQGSVGIQLPEEIGAEIQADAKAHHIRYEQAFREEQSRSGGGGAQAEYDPPNWVKKLMQTSISSEVDSQS